MVNEEARVDKVLQAKHQRSGHLGELRKLRNYVQDLIESTITREAELEDAFARYEEAFHNFVDSHDNYLRFEEDVEKKELMIDSYENQRDLKLQLDTLVRKWRVKGQRASPPSESCFSLRSGKSGKSNASSRKFNKKRE